MTTTTLPGAARLRTTDYGFFGPGSPTWKLWLHPTSMIGFQRSVMVEFFDPFLTASVSDTGRVFSDARGRFDDTLAYFLVVAAGDSRSALEQSQLLQRVHARSTGIEPVSGQRYSPNNPDSQLWIHITAWQSIIKCYEVFGPGKLDPQEEAQYWRECKIAAELQTCNPADVPDSREGVRDYYAMMRPKLCATEAAVRGMHQMLWPARDTAGLALWSSSRAIAPAVISTVPRWMRELGRFDQPLVLDRAIRPLGRLATKAADNPAAVISAMRASAPVTSRLVKQHYGNGEPENPNVVTVAEARAKWGKAEPALASV